MFPTGNPALTVVHPIFVSGRGGKPKSETFIRKENDDAVSAASKASGATTENTHEFRVMGADSQLVFPPVPTDPQVWGLSIRCIRMDGKHAWRMGALFGPQASGAESFSAQSVESGPPAPRKTPVREWMTCLNAPAQAGFPPTKDADASIGFSCMGYQSCVVVLKLCGAEGSALARLVGATPCAHLAKKSDIAQSAKDGYCLCCARATYVVIPPTYPLGGYHPLKARGRALWENFGPWALRRLGASHYIRLHESLTKTWYWAAEPPTMAPP